MSKLYGSMLLALLFFLSGFYLLRAASNSTSNKYEQFALEDPMCDERDYLRSGISYAPKEILENTKPLLYEDKNKKFLSIVEGQTLHSILSQQEIGGQEIHSLNMALKPFISARDLAPGDLYKFEIIRNQQDQALIKEFILKKVDSNRIPINYVAKRNNFEVEDPQFQVSVDQAEVREETELVQIKVHGTLFSSFMSLPFGNELMQGLMNVFAWRMRLPNEVLSKDHIEILLNKKYAEGNFIGYGKIQSVFYKQSHRTLFATHFRSKDGMIDGFYDETGTSLEKEFSLAPVYETVATSEQNWRMHPVRKKRIRHNGIDYRGTVGTDFFSIADGEVVEKRFDKMVGNMIRIRHKYGLYSEYFHADTLLSTLSIGSRVKRGQKIGTIGESGILCTGPHLHLGIYQMQGKRKKFVKLAHFRKKLSNLPPLSGAYLVEFKNHMKSSLAMMETIKVASITQKKNSEILVNR
ncbi:MAG: M23 family metallopeptidase [Myxococcales bacterium]|nr:M23 family metallopeptidase [Myxococcales bacterium]USN50306.1 MAG: M23 family metallopeptidase [Myxococcales bacterium]